ncbi:hypothetical protein [Actinosynnema sp. NPDC020468]|uniref:hypothetical protein n=1 Tax=Actinosynnema sp. NPDC020468 TaxID=3154488 RepID=UPI0033E21791
MNGRVSFDPRWLELYAQRVDSAATELSSARDAVSAPLGSAGFGEVGRTLRAAESYRRAAAVLRSRLDRACEVLSSASSGLHQVAAHSAGDAEALAALKRVPGA